MKKFLIGFFVFSSIFAGFGSVHAWSEGCVEENAAYSQAEADGTLSDKPYLLRDKEDCERDLKGKTFIEKGLVVPGKISRELEEFNLRVKYYSRPFKEKDLSFADWLDLYGYSTFGAGPVPHGDLSLPDASEFGDVGANTDLRSFILNVLNWILSFLGIVSIAVLVYAGYLCIITGGEDGSEKCKKILIYVAVGIIIILVSYAVVNTIIKSTAEGGDNFDGITSVIGTELVEGTIDVATVSGDPVLNYGSGFIVPDAVDTIFTAQSPDGSTPYNLRWNFGDGSIANSDDQPFTRSFFSDGLLNIVVIGNVDEEVDGEIVTHNYIGRVTIVVGSSVSAYFTMTPQNPEVGESIHFNADNSQATVGIINTYTWTCTASPSSLCDDFNSTNDNEIDFTPSLEGEITIGLVVTTNVGDTSEIFEKTFNVSEAVSTTSLKAKFNVSTMNPIVDNSVTFDGFVLFPAGIIADNYNWTCEEVGSAPASICTEFNNDSSGNVNFNTSFPNDGNVKISLTVEKNGEVSESFERIIDVVVARIAYSGDGNSTNIGNRINFDTPQSVWIGDTVPFLVKKNTTEEYSSYRWTFLEGEKEGESVTNTFQTIGENRIKLEALNEAGEIVASEEKKILVAEKDYPIPVLSINGEVVFPNDSINLTVGDSLNIQTNSFDGSGNQGIGADVIHSWVLNGSVVSEGELRDLSLRKGNYVLKLNAISTIDSNKRTALKFKINVSNELPKVNLIVTKSSLGSSFFTMKANIETENTIARQYKFSVIENGKTISNQVINSRERSVETIMDISNKTGDHNYLFQVTLIDQDGFSAKKSLNKKVTIKKEEILNNPPTVEIFTTPATSGLTSTMFHFYTQSDDIDNDFLTYKWEFPNGKKTSGKSVNHRFSTPGENTVKVTVSDGIEEVVSTENIMIEQGEINGGNIAPKIVSSGISPGNTGDTSTVFRFYAFAEDEDNDELEYSWVMGDGNVINLQNVSYTYQFPGQYSAKLLVTDGIKTITRSISIRVVAESKNIPPSTIVDYEKENDVTNASSFSPDSIAINTSLTDKNVAGFSEQVESFLDEKKIELAGIVNPKERKNLEKEIHLMESMKKLLVLYEESSDPLKKKTILNEINQRRLELESLNAELKFDFIGLEGTVNTRFFFYGKIPKSDRPILIKWSTGDNRNFIGQNVSWKYTKTGNYIVQMQVSDGISIATDTINIKIK